MENDDEHRRFQEAVFQRFANGTTFSELSKMYRIGVYRLRRAFRQWTANPPSRQPISSDDIDIPVPQRVAPTVLSKEAERLILNRIEYYADNFMPLSKHGVQDLVQHLISISPSSSNANGFKDNRPSRSWVNKFMIRKGLKYKSVRVIDQTQVDAVTPAYCAEHLAAIRRIHIRDASRIFNLDQSGSLFRRMVGRSLRKGVGVKNSDLIRRALRTNGGLERVTVMPVISASGRSFKPVVVYPGKHAHYRRVRGVVQTVHTFLPPCYFHQRAIPGVDSAIMYNWATQFVEGTKELRKGGEKLLLILDGYSAHVQFRFLNFMRENGVIVLGLPAHTSHVLQSLDVSVFSSFKSFLEREFHELGRVKSFLDVFDVASALFTAYFESLTSRNIRNGFVKTGLWNPALLDVDITALEVLFPDDEAVTLQNLIDSFSRRGRSLVHDADVESCGTIRVDTTAGAHLTSQTILDALSLRSEQRKKRKVGNKPATSRTKPMVEKSGEDPYYAQLQVERKTRFEQAKKRGKHVGKSRLQKSYVVL